MDFSLSDEQQLVIKTTREFVQNELYPHEKEVEESGVLREDLHRELKAKAIDAGLYGANMPVEVGGAGLDTVAWVLYEKELGRTNYALHYSCVGRPSNILLACAGVSMWGQDASAYLKQADTQAEADAAYDELIKRFPKREDGDKVLDEWAGVHYDAENFGRADEIFRRLTTEYPTSELADNALLNLAESVLVAGKFDEARTQLTALSKSPAADADVQQKALYQLVRLELDARRWESLRKICDESLARFPEGTFHRETGLIHLQAATEEIMGKIRHLAIKTKSPERLAAFYEEVFGLTRIRSEKVLSMPGRPR
jgi:tetratricopeptide (TPR) repeat protein